MQTAKIVQLEPENATNVSSLLSDRDPLNERVVEFGREIFSHINRRKPSIFSQKFWASEIMELSMRDPEFKLNMFRLVDVLPTLKDSQSLAKHISEYLGPVAEKNSALLKWAVDMDPNSARAALASKLTRLGVEQMAGQFIAGKDPESALLALRKLRSRKIAFTVDLLGEYSLSEKEATAYVNRYIDALTQFGKVAPYWPESKAIIAGHPGETSPICISVKLTALYSQCGPLNVPRSVAVLSERLAAIARKAREVNALIYVDAEDTANNEIIYKTFARVFGNEEFIDFPYPGIVVQAYAKGAQSIVEDLLKFSAARGTPIAIRLVKGAYWDNETVGCLQNNWPSPLFKVKESSDANYEKLSRLLLDNSDIVLPAFGSHNIRSLSHACVYAEHRKIERSKFELQMLFGMADPIAKTFVDFGYLVREYSPVGEMLPGMGYLIRRLLENTSNESFLRHTFFEADKIEDLLREPKMRD